MDKKTFGLPWETVWTIPQAAVWIRARDHQVVEALSAEATVNFDQADSEVPGTSTKAEALLCGLVRRRIGVRGWIRPAMVWPDPGWHENEANGIKRQRIPQEFWTDDVCFTSRRHGVIASEFIATDFEWVGIQVDAYDICRNWPDPIKVLSGGTLSLSAALGQLHQPPEDHPSSILAHASVKVTGLNSRSERVQIDPGVFLAESIIDIETNAVTTADEKHHWSAVTVQLVNDCSANLGFIRSGRNGPQSRVTVGGKSEAELNRQLYEWASAVLRAVNSVGKRVAKGPFETIAFERFRGVGGLTVGLVTLAWTQARETVDWPPSGTIPEALRLHDPELRRLLIEADLLEARPEDARKSPVGP